MDRPLHRRGRAWVALLVWLVSAVAGVALGRGVASAESPPLAISPVSDGSGARRTSFVFSLAPGIAQSDKVMVSNLGDETVNVRVYAVNAFTTPSGKIGVKSFNEELTVPATWLRFTNALGDGVLQIAPKTAKQIPFSVFVPSDAPPGDYAFGIAAMPVVDPIEPTEGENSLQIVTAVASLALVRVDGPLNPSVAILEFDATAKPPLIPGLKGGESTVDVLLVNTGNQKVNATVKITQINAFGRESYRYPDQTYQNLLPGSEIRIKKGWPDAPSLRGRINVEVTTDVGVSVTRSMPFWSIPWAFVGIVAGVLVVLLVVRRWTGRRRARLNGASDDPSLHGSRSG